MSQIGCQDRKHFPQVLLLVSPCFQAVDGERNKTAATNACILR